MSQYPEQIYRSSTASIVRQWREHGGKYRLEGSRCPTCGCTWFPRRAVCGNCNSFGLLPYACARTGIIEAISVENTAVNAFMAYGEQMPRYIVMIKLDDGLHIMSEVVETKRPGDVVTGARVHMVFRKHKRENNSNWAYGYKFVVDT